MQFEGHTKDGKCVFELETQARITCLTVSVPSKDGDEKGASSDSADVENMDDLKGKISKGSLLYFKYGLLTIFTWGMSRVLRSVLEFEKYTLRYKKPFRN